MDSWEIAMIEAARLRAIAQLHRHAKNATEKDTVTISGMQRFGGGFRERLEQFFISEIKNVERWKIPENQN